MDRRDFIKTSALLPIATQLTQFLPVAEPKIQKPPRHEFFDWFESNCPSKKILPWYEDVLNKIEDQSVQYESIYKGRQIGMTDFMGYFLNYQNSKNKNCLAVCHHCYNQHYTIQMPFVNIERNFACVNIHSPAARGTKWDYIYVDEAAYYSEDLPFWIRESAAKIILASTDDERCESHLMNRLDYRAIAL